MNQVKRIAVTGAAGQIGYSLLPRIANGDIFGGTTPVILQLLEVTPVLPRLVGVQMELEDCAFPLLQGIVCTDKPEVAFADADLILLVGSKPRGKGMERKDLILDNGPIFTGQGKAIAETAKKSVRTVVVGNPCNTNALIAMHNAPGIDPAQFTAMTMLDQNRGRSILAKKAATSWNDVQNLTIWGNHSNTQYPDWHHATIGGKKAADVIGDDEWLKKTFIKTVQERGKAVIEARGSSSAFSAAAAAIDHARALFTATKPGEWTSLCVLSDGSYGIEKDIICSFPCTTDGRGSWKIVQDLAVHDFSRQMIQRSVHELLEEREIVKHLLK